jgi:hypothetical protein
MSTNDGFLMDDLKVSIIFMSRNDFIPKQYLLNNPALAYIFVLSISISGLPVETRMY